MENVNNLNGVSNFGHGEPMADAEPVEEAATPEVEEEAVEVPAEEVPAEEAE